MPGGGSKPRKSQANNSVDSGEKPSDFVALISKKNSPKSRNVHFERLILSNAINGANTSAFFTQIEKNRYPVPILDKKRLKLSSKATGDNEFVPGTYASFNREDYIIIQAPTKENVVDFWRLIWQDGCRIVVCVVEKSKLSSDDSAEKCYQYWPTKNDATMEIGEKRFTIKVAKKKDEKGFSIYDLAVKAHLEADMTASAAQSSKLDGSIDIGIGEKDDNKPRHIILFHVTDWCEGVWPNMDHLGPFIKQLANREIQIMKKTTDDYIPPVVLQGMAALNRTCVVWVCTVLMKQIERRECFDVEHLARHLIRQRPGAFCNRMEFFEVFALAFRIASLGGWSTLEDARVRMGDIRAAAVMASKTK